MKMRHRAKTLTAVTVAVLVMSCGGAPSAAQRTDTTPSPAATPTVDLSSPSPTEGAASPTPPSPSSTATPGVACPARVTNISGKYTFQCPAGWHYLNCEGTTAYLPHTMLVNPDPSCNQEEYGVRAFAISFPGASGPPRYLGTQQSTK